MAPRSNQQWLRVFKSHFQLLLQTVLRPAEKSSEAPGKIAGAGLPYLQNYLAGGEVCCNQTLWIMRLHCIENIKYWCMYLKKKLKCSLALILAATIQLQLHSYACFPIPGWARWFSAFLGVWGKHFLFPSWQGCLNSFLNREAELIGSVAALNQLQWLSGKVVGPIQPVCITVVTQRLMCQRNLLVRAVSGRRW